MTNNLDENNVPKTEVETVTWQLNALTEALGDLTLTVDDSLSIGRGNDNDVVLGSKSVSRNHALLSVLNGDLYIKDLDSSNGTFINDERIEGNKSTHLNANDTVGFAGFAFKVAAPMAAETESTPVTQTVTKSGAKPVTATQADVASSDAELAQVSKVANTDEQVKEVPSAVATPVVTPTVSEQDSQQPTVLDSAQVDAQETTNTLDESVIDADSVVSSPVVSPVEPATEESTVVDSVESTKIDSTKMDSTKTESALSEKADEPVVKETIVADVLSSTASEEVADTPVAPIAEPTSQPTSAPSTAAEKETVMSNDKPKETLNNEPTVNEPVAKQPTAHQEPDVAPEHDKTTTTTLQEEADPDVLRAKQAATAQFSGTANLGQARDLGTEGNNAMDQAIDNPANAGHVEKKPSGSWFIWVFVVILIIGIALWLFNMGGV